MSHKSAMFGGLVGLAMLGAVGAGFAAGHASSTRPGVVETQSFTSCAAAGAAGYHDMQRGGPGYSSRLDGDGDGVACDTPTMTFAECQKTGEYPGGRYAVEYDNGVCTVQKP